MPETRLQPGADIGTAVKVPGNTVLLADGARYTANETPDFASGVSLIGNATVACSKGAGFINGRKDVKIQGVAFDGRDSKSWGISIYKGAENVALESVRILNFGGMGLKSEGDGKRVKGVSLTKCEISGSWSSDGNHVSGLFASETDGIVLSGVLLSQNGWKPGVQKPTIYNHNAYIQSTCGPATVTDLVSHDASSHGIQMRSGGTLKRALFVGCPIAFTFGYVEGGPVVTGGIEGEVEDVVVIGSRDIRGERRGWAFDIGNAKDVVLRRLVAAHYDNARKATDKGVDALGNVKSCLNIKAGVERPRDQQRIRLEDFYGYDWRMGEGGALPLLEVQGGFKVTATRAGIAPPVSADLLALLGNDWLVRARASLPTFAGSFASKAFVAIGVTAPAPESQAPAAPADVKVADNGAMLDVTWSKVPGATYRVLFNGVDVQGSSNEHASLPRKSGAYSVVAVKGDLRSPASVAATWENPRKAEIDAEVKAIDVEKARLETRRAALVAERAGLV